MFQSPCLHRSWKHPETKARVTLAKGAISMVDKNDDDNPEVDDVDGDNEDECEKVGKK